MTRALRIASFGSLPFGVLMGTLLVGAALIGCDNDNDPVDIPFSGVDVSSTPQNKLPTAFPELSAEPSATAPKPGPVAVVPGGGISGCCNVLSALAKSAKDEGTRAVNQQAAKVCFSKSKQVVEGTLTREQALAQVRSSLLGSAPPACR